MNRIVRKRVATLLLLAMVFTVFASASSPSSKATQKKVTGGPVADDPTPTPKSTATPVVGDLKVHKVTKNTIEFTACGYERGYGYIQWRKKGAKTWEKKDMLGAPKVTGLKAGTTYEIQYFEQNVPEVDIVIWKSRIYTCSTAAAKAPAVASIKITKGKNHKYGYRDILGIWHTTGTAATGRITVTFKKKPTAKYAVIYQSNGVHCVEIKGKKAVVTVAQFQRGSKKGGTTKVWVQTASDKDYLTMQTGLSPKTKKKTVKIK